MKECHPDLSGDDQDTTNFCMFINEVYEVGYQIQRMLNALSFVLILRLIKLEPIMNRVEEESTIIIKKWVGEVPEAIYVSNLIL